MMPKNLSKVKYIPWSKEIYLKGKDKKEKEEQTDKQETESN